MKSSAKHIVRLVLIPLAIISFVWGFLQNELLIFGIMGGVFLLLNILLYSGRTSRIRYWFQGYKVSLRNNRKAHGLAIKEIQKDFCCGKYGDKDVCNKEYENIDTLVEDIIKREFKFERLIHSSDHIQKGLLAYQKETERLKMEISKIRKEVLGDER